MCATPHPAPGRQPAQPWTLETSELLSSLQVNPAEGLQPTECAARRRRYGDNLLQTTRRRRLLSILLDQFRSIVIGLLGLAAAISMLVGDRLEGMAVLAVIAINTAIGFVTEWRATRSMEALRQLGQFETVVRRGGVTTTVPAFALVPGDIVLAEGGDIITADLRLLEASKLAANESSLTGESTPVGKSLEALPADTPVAERRNMLFKGTSLARGSALGVVVGTGVATELGRIAQLVSEAEPQVTPLEKRLDALGRRLVWVMLAIAALIAVAGVVAGRDTVLAIQVAVALTVAAIPEGLPIVATIALARGMWRMARRRALITRLSAVETLGATGVIMADKTGTLTENRMTVTVIELPERTVEVGGTGLETRGPFLADGAPPDAATMAGLDALLTAVTLCSNAVLYLDPSGDARVVGDPTETALLIAAAKRRLQRDVLLQSMPELREEAFDPESKAMATFNRDAGGLRVTVKGAPERVLPACTQVRCTRGDVALDREGREAFLARIEGLATKGLRTLAIAERAAADLDESPYRQLTLLGAVGLMDPPRAGVREAIARCRAAGIRVIMITGDHLATARNVAETLNLVRPDEAEQRCIDASTLTHPGALQAATREGARVIARATPGQKLQLIEWFQQQGQVVAMTGDGVNDAPALSKADIGVAMGLRGTAVAREAAAMVLQDDRFSTIVAAVEHGRAIFANIRRFVVYLLSCNISEILVVGLATVAGAPLPLLPLQILFLNLVTDVFPALALGVGPGGAKLMHQRPRASGEPILTREHWARIMLFGLLMSASVLGAMTAAVWLLGYAPGAAVTVSFCTLALGQVWHVVNMREHSAPWWRNEIVGNPWMWWAVALCILLILSAVLAPGLSRLMRLAAPGPAGWLLIGLFSLLPVLLGPAARRAAAALARWGWRAAGSQ